MSTVSPIKPSPFPESTSVEDIFDGYIAAAVYYNFYNPAVKRARDFLLDKIAFRPDEEFDGPDHQPRILNSLVEAQQDLWQMQKELEEINDKWGRDNEISLHYVALHINNDSKTLNAYVLGADAPTALVVSRRESRLFLLDADDRGYRRLPDCQNSEPMTYTIPFIPGDRALITSAQKDSEEWDHIERLLRQGGTPKACYKRLIASGLLDHRDDLLVMSSNGYYPNRSSP